ncbi:MAG TPA: WYL domain-containing protein, partial [Membranihabitans sp.]|nr:WYL domain-containing protein [Membranihabitans sp.]
GFISEKPIDDVHVELIFKTHSGGEGFARWFLMFADHARILEPESLRLRVAEILENAIRKLEQ